MGDLEYQRKHLRSWMRTRSRGWLLTRSGLRQQIRHDPLGVVGVMGPWNFPVQLTMLPAGTALAAGNRVMVRPSEITAVTTALLADLAAQYFPVEELAVLTDEQADGPTFAALGVRPPVLHRLACGRRTGGAGRGQEPGSGDAGARRQESGGGRPQRRSEEGGRQDRRITHGQRRAGVHVPGLRAGARGGGRTRSSTRCSRSGATPFRDILGNGDYTSVISERHFDHVVGLIDDAVGLGAQRMDSTFPPARRCPIASSRKIAPTILTGVPGAARVNREEIFGPLLVVHPYRELSEAIDYVNAPPHPLTIYWYGDDNDRYDELQGATRSGSVNANDFTLNFIGSELPFGGVGHSGSGVLPRTRRFRHLHPCPCRRLLPMAGQPRPNDGAAVRSSGRAAGGPQLAAFRRRNRRRTKS